MTSASAWAASAAARLDAPAAKALVAEQLAVLEGPASVVARQAALDRLTRAGADVVPELLRRNETDRDFVFPILARMPAVSVPVLIQLVEARDPELGSAAADALAVTTTPGSFALGGPLLSCLMKAREDEVRRPCGMALVRAMGPKAGAQVPALVEAYRRANSDVKPYLAGALGQIGPKAQAAAPVLTQALRAREPATRMTAAAALGKLKARRAIPDLEAAVKDEDGDVRREAARALKALEKTRAK